MIEKRTFKDSYESIEHLIIEREVIAKIEQTSNIFSRKLPKRDILDFCMTVDDVVIGFLEVRSRSCSWSKMQNGGFYLPLKKMTKIRSIYLSTKVPTCLVVRCSDSAWKCWLGNHEEFKVKWWGDERSDKDFDREPMVAIPDWFFKKFYTIQKK